jgi:hypothetical protein
MKKEKIKPIPKYMIELIRKEDIKSYPAQDGKNRYYAYLTKNDGELVKVTVAVKCRYKKWYCKQVIVHGLHSKDCFIKDIAFYYLGGYITGWFAEGFTKYPKWYEDNIWDKQYDRLFDPYAPVVNIDYLQRFPEYKYSQIENYHGVDILQYLRLYEQYPQMEYMMKLGLSAFVMKKTILRKLSKSKDFTKWLIRHKTEITKTCYAETVLTAYKRNKSITETQKRLTMKKHILRSYGFDSVRKLFKGNLERLLSYIERQNIDENSYRDYIYACNYLQIDLADTKNLLPIDFKRWHDERIGQMRILREEARRKYQAEYERIQAQKERNFPKIVKKYLALQNCSCESYVIFIAHSPAELIQEGQAMSHCVGGENYRERMSKGDSLIFFLRRAEEPDKSFVTLEYSPTRKTVLQCYAYDNTKPEQPALDFVNQIWLPYANATVNKMQRRKKAV